MQIMDEAESHVRRLQEDGYTVLKGQFDQEGARAAINEYTIFINSLPPEDRQRFTKPDGFMTRLASFHSASEAVQRLYAQAELYYQVAYLFFGCRPPVIDTSLFFANGTQQSIHRDSPAFCTLPEGEFLGCWFALENATSINGALEVVRGGHKFVESEFQARLQITEQVGSSIDAKGLLWGKYQGYVRETIVERGLEAKTLEAELGDVIIWHPHLPHGGGKIQDGTLSRYSTVFHVTPLGSKVYDHDAFWYPQRGFKGRAARYRKILDTEKLMREAPPVFQM